MMVVRTSMERDGTSDAVKLTKVTLTLAIFNYWVLLGLFNVELCPELCNSV